MLGFFLKLGEGSNGTFTITVQNILGDDGDDTVVALVTHLAQRDDIELQTPAVHVWQVQDGNHEPCVIRLRRTRLGRVLVIGRPKDALAREAV